MNEIDTISGAPDGHLPHKDRVVEMLDIIDHRLSLLVKLIDDFGIIKVIPKNNIGVTYDDLFHDFVFYGLTKSCKSFLAIRILIENLYQEDAQILLRSTYETYLAIKFVHKNPQELFHYTRKSVGVSTGFFKHPTSKKGRLVKNKIINPDTGDIEDYGLPISTLTTAIESKFELEIHKFLYTYLCEFTHLNMIASGTYREPDEKRYTYYSPDHYDHPVMYLEYIMQLYFDLIVSEIGILHDTLPYPMFNFNQLGKATLSKYISDFITEKEDENFRKNILERMDEVKTIKEVLRNEQTPVEQNIDDDLPF